jgi:hydrogenase maturation protein HypF
VGGETKNTVCVTCEDRAILSSHVGDLGHPLGFHAFVESVRHLVRLAGVEPVAIAHDLHPDYHSTNWAASHGVTTVPVQHHHAHVASCMVEHGREGTVLGVAFDGTGYGTDGTMWGGELLQADLRGFLRLGHVRALRLVGGEAAIREPWRLALAALRDAGEPLDLLAPIHPQRLQKVEALWRRDSACTLSTGAGRWFDAVAALLGLRHEVSYDGQAATELEALARSGTAEPYPFTLSATPLFEVDLRPMVRDLAAEIRLGLPPPDISARFHETLARVVLAACRHARQGGGVPTVVLTGGCFQNRLLAERSRGLLEEDGFEVLTHKGVPANDGGLALGQAAVAVARLTPGVS